MAAREGLALSGPSASFSWRRMKTTCHRLQLKSIRILPANLSCGLSAALLTSFIWACCFMRTGTSSMRFSIAWLEAMRLRGLSSHGTLGWAVQILSSSFCGCNRQFYSLVPPMLVRCGLQPQLALALSGSFSSFGGPSSAELAVSRKVFLWTSYFRSCNRCVGMTSGGGGSLVSDRLWLRLIQALYTA